MSESKELAFRKIGRNVVHFQKFEGMLKFLLSQSNFQCPVSKLHEILQQREKNFEQQSLGNLVKEYSRVFRKNDDRIRDFPKDRDEPWFSFYFSIENEEELLNEQKSALSFLVSERNRLIHQMLIKFEPDSVSSCNALIIELDKQNAMIKREFQGLQEFLRTLLNARDHLLNELSQNSKNLNGND